MELWQALNLANQLKLQNSSEYYRCACINPHYQVFNLAIFTNFAKLPNVCKIKTYLATCDPIIVDPRGSNVEKGLQIK